MNQASDYDPPLDPGIAGAVLLLSKANVETYESVRVAAGPPAPNGDSQKGRLVAVEEKITLVAPRVSACPQRPSCHKLGMKWPERRIWTLRKSSWISSRGICLISPQGIKGEWSEMAPPLLPLDQALPPRLEGRLVLLGSFFDFVGL